MYYSASLMDEIGNRGFKYKNLRFSVGDFIIHDHFGRFFDRDLLDLYRLVLVEVQFAELPLDAAYPQPDDLVGIAGRRIHVPAEYPVLTDAAGLLAQLTLYRLERILSGLEFACGEL